MVLKLSKAEFRRSIRLRILKLIILITFTAGSIYYFLPSIPIQFSININRANKNNSNSATSKTKNELHFKPPAKLETIFMIDTSGLPDISIRRACSVESAARANPLMTVILYVSSPKISTKNSKIAALLKLRNVQIVHLNVPSFFSETPLESWYFDKIWAKEIINAPQLNDAIRFLTLWKFGGIYLDWNIIVLKSLEKLHNCIGRVNKQLVTNKVMAFEKYHPFLMECCKKLEKKRPTSTDRYNGSKIVTSLLVGRCSSVSYPYLLSKEICGDIALMPKSAFYPVSRALWWKFFDPSQKAELQSLLLNSYTVQISSRETVKIGASQPLEFIFQKLCPSIYQLSTKLGKF